MTIDELNARYFENYLRDHYNMDVSKNNNFNCLNTSAHKHGDKNPSMRLYERRTQITLLYL